MMIYIIWLPEEHESRDEVTFGGAHPPGPLQLQGFCILLIFERKYRYKNIHACFICKIWDAFYELDCNANTNAHACMW